jgi:Carboxypeptidase regulatory-like domain/TonB-dependent Receptor Plug Domain
MVRKIGSVAVALLLACGTAAIAQESASSGIVGQVTDATHGTLPGATVTVINVGTNAQRVTTTDAEGRFSVPNLPAATYTVRVELAGFQTVELKDFTVRNGEIAKPSITLGVANVAETITVAGESPLLQTQSASVGQTISQKQIDELPVNGRTLLSLASLSAGVTPKAFNRGTQFGAAGSSRNQYVTVEGGRDSSTNYTVDGVYVRSLRFNNLSLAPPIDSVQEVSILRNAFSTEYGQGQAVVSIVTKSGTNQLSGSGYEFVRSDTFDARNFFAAQKPSLKRNQFGATGGGPVKKNKVFVFGSYEGLRTEKELPFLASVPSPTLLSGNFSSLSTSITDPTTGQPFSGNIIPSSRFSNFARILAPTIPTPNVTGANNYNINKAFNDDADTATVRSDQVFSHAHSLFERFMIYDGRQLNPSVFSYTNLPQKGRNLAIGHTWVISTQLVNETRVGYNYAYHLNSPISLDGRNWVADIGLQNLAGGTDPIDYGRPGFNISGFTGNGEGGITQGATENIFSVSNATSWVKGRHNLRFGLQAQYRKFEHLTEVPPRGGFTFNGTFTGNAIADFLLGYCSTCTGAFGNSRSHYTSPTVSPFIDDVWQVSNKLTVQAGLRWEYLAPWHETDNLEGVFDPVSGKIAYHVVPSNLPSTLVPLVNQQITMPAGIVRKDFNNWGPRVGVVYNLSGSTVMRAGFGIYYDNLNLNELQFTRLVPPFYGQYSLTPTRTAPLLVDSLFPSLNNIAVFPAPFSIDPDNQSPFTRQWNANVQHTFGRDYVVEVAYTGSQSRHEHKRYNINQARPGTTPIETRVPYPAFQSAILYSSDAGHGDFKGLSFRLEKRYSRGLYFLANYQVSVSKDNGSGEIEANDTAFAWDLNADWGYARYDQRHRSAFSVGYEIPFGPGKAHFSSGPMSHVLGNWNVQGIMRLASGFPFTVSATNVCQCGSFVPQRVNLVNPGNFGELDDRTPNRWFDKTAYLIPAAGQQGTAGRNTVRGPGTQVVDLSLIKRVPFSGTRRFEFRWEVFNLLNHPNFGNPDANISNNTAGVISTADDGRNMQFGVRVVW